MADSAETSKQFGVKLSAIPYAIVNLVIISVVAYLAWVLFADPKIGVWKTYPQPFGAVLFWGIMVLVFISFACGNAFSFFTKLKQPMSGVVALLVNIAISLGCVWLLSLYGKVDPTFDPKGVGYVSAAMLILIGFYCWGNMCTNMDGWPWKDAGLPQPLLGITGILAQVLPTLVLYFVLIYPNLAPWTSPDRVPMALPTVIGWFYSCILSWVTWNNVFDLWPWTTIESRGKRAIVSYLGNFFLGTFIYFAAMFLLKNFLIPAEAQAKIGEAINLWAAQLEVIILTVMFVWVLLAGNWPTNLGTWTNRIIRFVIVFGGGILAFVVYMNGFAVNVLHEAEIVSGFGGDPLNFVDLFLYVLLIWVCFFGCYGITKKQA